MHGRLTALGLWLLGALVAACCVLAMLATVRLLRAVDEASDLHTLLETHVDHQIAAGLHADAIAPEDPLLAVRKILLPTEVNERIAADVVARLLLLNERDRSAPIDLYIATSGGWVDSAFAIIDAMQLIEAPVNTWAIGGSFSSGALILAAGTGRRYATTNALLMVHANREDSSEPHAYEPLDLERYERLWRRTSRLPDDWYPLVGDVAYYLTAEQALQYGIIDEIVAFRHEAERREHARAS